MTHGTILVHIDEHPGAAEGAGRLGRHVEHDSRSLSYLIDPTGIPIVTQMWGRSIPILDQGNLGSCTGNAATGALGTAPFFATETIGLDENEAVNLYEAATLLDSDPQHYPPDDTGSTGLAVAKACKNAGLISGYQHATSLAAMLAALMAGPVIMGANWYEGFDSPDGDGFVTISGNVRGGHEFELRGVDVEKQRIHADNSWGAGWGKNGSFSFSYADAERLLGEQGDVTVFTPLNVPAPVPTPIPVPVPTPTPGPGTLNDDLAAVLEHVLATPWHYFGHHSAAVARAWLAANGYPTP